MKQQIGFFTSSLGVSYELDGQKYAQRLDNSQGLLSLLAEKWPINPAILMLSSDPTTAGINDFYADLYREAFNLSHLSFSHLDIYDNRYQPHINNYQIIILAGGHTPTQNQYFNQIDLKHQLTDYQGIIIGISAGSMNAADLVYAAPELPGEAVDPNFKRYLSGLNLFPLRILPHYHDLISLKLDEKDLIQEIILPDSYIHDFYALNDGSFFYQANNDIILYGDAYYFKQGNIKYLKNNAAFKELRNTSAIII